MDYFQILNLQREPFSNSPEPEFFFESSQHRGCLQKLELAIRLRRGLNVVMGEVGTGKTTLCRRLIMNFSQTDEDRKLISTHLILDPSFTNALEFLSIVAISFGLSLPDDGESEWQLKENIKNYLFCKGIDEAKTVVLIIDEGQKLPDFCLEFLREFLNYETNEYKLLQIVIFAQKEFEQVLQAHANFADRVNQYYYLKPLNFRETRAMIRFRITLASDSCLVPVLFTLPALWAIFRATGGYPRKIITLCHQVMLAMIIQNRVKAGLSLVRSCAGRVSPAERQLPRWALTTAGFVLFLFLGMLAYGRIDLLIDPQEKETFKASPPKIVPVVPPVIPATPAVTEETPKKSQEEKPPAETIAGAKGSKNLPSPSKTYPEVLGQLVVKRNDCVLWMVGRIYGKNAIFQLERIAEVNPHIRDLDRVRKGDVINIPARPRKSNPMEWGKYWVQIARTDDLGEAYKSLAEYAALPALFLLPYWNRNDGLAFAILLKEGFADESAALSVIKKLPVPFAGHARVVSDWPEGTVFL